MAGKFWSIASVNVHRVAGSPRAEWRRLAIPLLAALLVHLGFAGAAFAANDTPAVELRNDPWRDPLNGVSLRPPLDSRIFTNSADRAVLRIAGSNYSMEAYISKSTTSMELVGVSMLAMQHVAMASPSSRVIEEMKVRADGRPGALLVFQLPKQDDGEVKILGQTLFLINDKTLLLLQLRTSHADYEAVRPIYRAVVDTLRFEDPQEIDRRRTAKLENGNEWLKQASERLSKAPLLADQWYRIIQKRVNERGQIEQDDIGYLNIRQSRDQNFLKRDGIIVDVRSRLNLPNGAGQPDLAADSIGSYFISTDRHEELWFLRTLVRQIGGNRYDDRPIATKRKKLDDDVDLARMSLRQFKDVFGQLQEPELPGEQSNVETGVRTGDQVMVMYEGPAAKEPMTWKTPDIGYLSQAEVYLLGQFTPAKEAEMGFYAYYPHTQKVSFREVNVEVGPRDSSVIIKVRPSPELPHEVSTYNLDGTLIRRDLDGGRMMIPATVREIRQIWRMR